jgi:hypothetical protein
MNNDQAGKTNLRTADKVITGLLIASALLFLCAAVFPAPIDALLQFVSGPLQWGDPDRNYNGDYLHNGDFQGGSHEPSSDLSDAGVAKGEIGDGWVDASDSYQHGLRYSIDKTVTHDGHPSQRIDIPRAGWVEMVQLTQSRVLPFGYYRAIVWVRSTPRMAVAVSLNNGNVPVQAKVIATAAWHKIEFSEWNWSWNRATFTISEGRPGSVWIADADLRRTSDVYFIALAVILALALMCVFGQTYIRRSLAEAGPGSITVKLGDHPADKQAQEIGNAKGKQ